MGSHRTTIKRKKPLTHTQSEHIAGRAAIKSLHTQMKTSSTPSVPLSIYQTASSKGQDVVRGGDSSKELVKWLNPLDPLQNIRVLEIGCLEIDNAIAKWGKTKGASIRRIDLKSRDPRIEEQDFMTLRVPKEVVSQVTCSNE